jgi:Na+-driven multidrug efflux pump
MCGAMLLGFWWIFPLGLVMCLVFMALHFVSRRRDFRGIPGHGGHDRGR